MSKDSTDGDVVDETTDETTSTALRWQYTNDVIAGGYLFAYLLLTALDGVWVVDLTALPTFWRVAAWTIALTAAAWTFGGAAVEAAAGAVSK